MTKIDLSSDIFRSKGVRTLRWFVWKALWPGLILALFYPLYAFIIRDTHPFAHAFGHGDYLRLSLLLLLETAMDSEHLRHRKVWLEVLRHTVFVVALVLTLLFVASKVDILVILPKESPDERVARMVFWALLNCLSVGLAVALGLVAYYAACEVEEEHLLETAALDG